MVGEYRLDLVPGSSARGRSSSQASGRLPAKGGWARDESDGREALGGLTSKVHLLSDDRARPLNWQTSPGQRGDSPTFAPVLDGLRIRRRVPGHRPRTRPDRVRGDTAYSSRGNRAYLRRRGIKATIAQPDDQRAHRKHRGQAGGWPPAFDKAQYRRRQSNGA